ncbi:hypothetical protein GJAV_G00117790 [Gymnothorax javanicus]|nr:hypothetical protein GJAV_G00117790 [Gymnothorax javanicus]
MGTTAGVSLSTTELSHSCVKITSSTSFVNMLKICTIKSGETLDSDRTFVQDLRKKVQLTEVREWDECDIILKFCAVASRPGPDVESAVEEIPANKPAVLVVMHHTWDQDFIVSNSNNYGTRKDVIIVNCLFHEKDGLLQCSTNGEALEITLTHMKKFLKRTPLPQSQDKLRTPPPQPQDKQICIPHDSLEHTTVPDMNKETSKEGLREKIKEISPTAEENLRDAGLTDDEILTLTLPEVSELLPGIKNFKKRREIMALIKQHFSQREDPDQDQEPKELDEEQVESGNSSSSCEWTSSEGLREKISKISPTAGENLRVAGLSDDQILTLTLPEVSELLPGIHNFQKRREIMDLIKQHTSQTEELPPAQLQHELGPSSVPDTNEEVSIFLLSVGTVGIFAC